MAMDVHPARDASPSIGKFSLDEDILVGSLLIGHNPDGRLLDSETMIGHVENVMNHVLAPQVTDCTVKNKLPNIEVLGSEEPLQRTICKISMKMCCDYSGHEDIHGRTMDAFDLLENHRWDAKVIVVLAALGIHLGRFLLVERLFFSNPLAASAKIARHLPCDASDYRSPMKSFTLLAEEMIDVAKSIISFEGLPLPYVKPDKNTEADLKSQVYIGAYWTVRSAFKCAGQIMESLAQFLESKNKARELSSLGYNLSSIGAKLKRLIAKCQKHIETETNTKLLTLFKTTHQDNQEVLHLLLALKDNLPLRNRSKLVCVSELKDKTIILIISRPELVPMTLLFLLFHQTYDHPHRESLDGVYEIVWVPLSTSFSWSEEERSAFNFFASSVPWCSVRRPWLLSQTAAKFIRREWKFGAKDDEAIMVVLDPQGNMINPNAMDMVLIWGTKAYPYSVARENELWKLEDSQPLQLLLHSIDPIFTAWMEQGKEICIYGGGDSKWIQQVLSEASGLRAFGVEAEFVYVRNKGQVTNSREKTHHGVSLSRTKSEFFWLRLESIRRSKVRRGVSGVTDRILRDIEAVLEYEGKSESWGITGKGWSSEIVTLKGERLVECLRIVRQRKGEYGLLDGISRWCQGKSLDEPCRLTQIVPYEQGRTPKAEVCADCKRRRNKFVVYQ